MAREVLISCLAILSYQEKKNPLVTLKAKPNSRTVECQEVSFFQPHHGLTSEGQSK